MDDIIDFGEVDFNGCAGVEAEGIDVDGIGG